jgi:peptidoglycan/LPS O-acetylase OafA/YrhL
VRNIRYRRDIQILRGIAVLAVLLFHADKSFFPHGYLGVDVFFVISGFVVTPLIFQIYRDSSSVKESLLNLKNFYIMRFYRLAPALITTLIISTILIFFLAPTSIHKRFALQGITTLLLVGNFGAYRYSGNYFSPEPNPLVHTWSLSVEEQIYLILPLITFMVFYKFKNYNKSFLKMLIILTAFSFILFCFPIFLQPVYSITGIDAISQFSFYSTLNRIWQFTLGGVLCFITSNKQLPKNRFIGFLSICLTLCLLVFLFTPISIRLEMGSIIATLLAIAVIFCRSLEIIPNIFSKILQWNGDRSYSIYLAHMPIIYLAQYSPFFATDSDGYSLVPTLIAIVITFMVGNFNYLKIENRYRLKRSFDFRVSVIYKVSVYITLVPFVLFAGVYMISGKELAKDPNVPFIVDSKPWDHFSSCKFVNFSFQASSRPCLFPSINANKNFLLIGDSTAASLSKTLISIAKNNNANIYIYTFSSCPFFTSDLGRFQTGFYSKFTEGCASHNKNIMNFLDHQKIDIIFYSQTAYVPIKTKIVTEVPKLKSFDNRVIFLGITPEYIPHETILSNVFNSTGKYSSDAGLVNNFFKAEFSKSSIEYLDFWQLFCTSLTNCTNRKNSVWLFEDTFHISQEGGSIIKPEIQKAIQIPQ